MDASQISQLCHADRFDHPVEKLQLIETHISWVLLTGPFVYKIKKPVNFGFLDFSTLDKRQFCCSEELRLNSRACEGLYLAVVPVTCFDERVAMEGAGDIIEYAVKMRQFDPHAILTDLLAAGQVCIDEFVNLGYRIGAFHAIAEVAEKDAGWGNLAAVEFPVAENFRQILPLVPNEDRALVAALQEVAKDSCASLQTVFEKRKRSGFVRELHGDLHAGNIALIDQQWVPFDCVEFNPNLRWIDTASDIAFLVMDLEFRGYKAQANRFLNAYLEYTGDYDLVSVLRFYLGYRAMVRAKVAILRLQQANDAAARFNLLKEFHGYLRYSAELQNSGRPCLMMMMGVSGSGKSTIARQVAQHYGAIHLRSDALRKGMFGLRPNQVSQPGKRDEIYAGSASRRMFAYMLELAEALVGLGYPVILDATFIRCKTRLPFIDLAQRLDVPFAILRCCADENELVRRITARMKLGNDASEADVQVMKSQLQHYEPLSETELQFQIDTNIAGWEQQLSSRVG